jgi:hypothetical protein
MPPRMTNMQCIAREAHEHIFAPASALAFVNEYSGAAAPPALYHAFADRQLAWPWPPLYRALGDDA